jgi:hypothetical protein
VVAAQTSLWLDAALSSARPPAGALQLETTNYGILGLRGERAFQLFQLSGNLSAGRAMESAGGRWLWLQGDAEHRVGKLSAYWLDYAEEVNYRAGGVQMQRDFKFANDALLLRPMLSVANWKSKKVAETYAAAGGTVQWTRPFKEILFQLNGDAYWVGNNGLARGGYASLGAHAYYVFRGTTVGASVTQGLEPDGSDTGFMVWAARPVNEQLRIDFQVAQTVTDPVFGAPGNLGITLSGSWRFMHRERAEPMILATVGNAVARGRIVKFTVAAPSHATTVSVSGTFTDWQPVALKRDGKAWSGSVTVPAGTHQYGFLLNDTEWFVPPNATEVIDDGFGRKNVTLIVRPK